MNATTAQPKENQTLVALFGIVATLLIIGVLTNATLQFGIGDRVAFFTLVVIGMAMCGMGKLGQGAVYGWSNPLHLTGYILGTIGLLLAALVLFNVPVPFIATERAALVALTVLMLVKLGVAQMYQRQGSNG